MKEDELAIYSGKSPGSFDTKIGNIKVDGKTVVVTLDDITYRFSRETDRDFLNFAELCVKSDVHTRFPRQLPGSFRPGFTDTFMSVEMEHICKEFTELFSEYKG